MEKRPLKILMTAMSMGYGGAETHILELSRSLKSHGMDVAVISGGGVYVEQLEKCSIEHITAPMNNKHPKNMLKSRSVLRETIKRFQPDIVHAHARIPAFICEGLCKKYKIPLVTTVHGTYKTPPLLRIATTWGDCSIAVSGDIKEYLQKHYNFDKSRIFDSVNGINTAIFSPEAAFSDTLRHELGIADNEKVILNVSRLDKQFSSLTAIKLCHVAERLYERYPNSRIVIVGGGEVYEQISSRSKAVNAAIGKEYIVMTGGRTDIHRFAAMCDVFIGISRAALEVISCGKNVVLCGDMGYLGRFCNENIDSCIETNFTCRGYGYPEDLDGTLLSDIDFCFNEEHSAILRADRETGISLVRERYSVERMSDDAYSAYLCALQKYKAPDITLTGYYGRGNMGDDALLFLTIENIKRQLNDIKICVLASNPKRLEKRLAEYFSFVEVKRRFNIFSIKKTIKKSKALVFGGGTLIQNTTSTKSLLYYLYLLNIARKVGKKTVLYANGIGPVRGKKNMNRVKRALSRVSLITLRDEESLKVLENIGVTGPEFHLCADEAMTLGTQSIFYPQQNNETVQGKDYICICARRWKNSGSSFYGGLTAAADYIYKKYSLRTVYIVMEPGKDDHVTNTLAEITPRASVVRYDGNISPVLSVISRASAVISMRLHALIFAAVFGVPAIGISYDPKVKSFLNQIAGGMNICIELDDFSKDALLETFDRIYGESCEFSHIIKERTAGLKGDADKNVVLLAEELMRGEK